MGAQHTIVVTEGLSSEALEWLSDRAIVRQVAASAPAFTDALSDATALIVRTYTTVTPAMLDRAPCLKVVGRAGTGLDNIDLDACRERGIAVVHTPAANRQAVVEYVTSIIMSALRPVPPAVPGGLDEAGWRARRAAAMAPRQVSELLVGILGFGQIGRRVAAVLEAIGARVQFHDLLDIPHEDRGGATAVSFEALLRTSDLLTVHVDGRPENRHLIGEAACGMLKPDVLLINTSRGFVIDGDALGAWIDGIGRASPHGFPGRAILDVHEAEPVPADCPLLDRAEVVLLPHAASRTEAAQRGMSDVVRRVWQVLAGST